MTTRRALFAAALALAALPLAAGARGPSCRLLPGTPSWAAGKGVPYESPLSIQFADVASDATRLTAVVRVHDLADPATSAAGRLFGFYLSRNVEENYYLTVELWPTAMSAVLWSSNAPFDPQKGVMTASMTALAPIPDVVVDKAASEVRMTVPLALFRLKRGSTMKPRNVVTYLGAETDLLAGIAPGTLPSPT